MSVRFTLVDFFGFTCQRRTLKRKPTDSCLDERPAKRTLTVQEVPLDSGVKKLKIPNIFKLPNETIHGICAVAEDKDLRNLLLVNHALGSIASPIYTTRLGIRKGVKSHTIALEGESFRALGAWKRSRLFASLEHGVQLYCTIDHKNLELAAAQVHCLRTFLSADFTGTPFSSIVINGVCHMNPTDIVDFIRLIDKVGCYSATVMSPYGSYKHSPADIASSFPPVTLSNLKRLELNTSHFVDQEWSQFLRCLTGSKLASLSVRGAPPFVSLFRFLSRHPSIESLESNSCWAHFVCMPSSGFPRRIIQMPHLERLDGPPCHLQPILNGLSHIPKTLALQFIPEHEQSYSEFVTQILHTVRVCDGPDSKLDVTIHFRKRHFELEPNYKFDVCAMDALGVEGPGVKSLYLFLPAIQEKNVLDICTQWLVIWPELTGIQVRLPKQGLAADIAAARYRRGWASSSHTGGDVVVEWQGDDNTISK